VRHFLFPSVLVLAIGCGHTHVAADAPAAPAASTAAPPAADTPSAPVATVTRARPTRRDPKPPTLVASPAAALAAGGIDKLQARLVATGDLGADAATGHLDDATEHAVRTFQRARNLPATGVPDDATVRALGLRPEDLFRRAPP
jgi:peptidoglycan hydrolase-like protein with peptidoglycan-binding domain